MKINFKTFHFKFSDSPLPESLEDGVKMTCGNASCPCDGDLVHRECFDRLQGKLVEYMASIGFFLVMLHIPICYFQVGVGTGLRRIVKRTCGKRRVFH